MGKYLESLESCGIVYSKGRGRNASYFIKELSKDRETKPCDVIPTSDMNDKLMEEVSSLKSSITDITHLFYHEMSLLKSEFREKLSSRNNDHMGGKYSNEQDLKKEIIFLRDEIKSKNVIINILHESLLREDSKILTYNDPINDLSIKNHEIATANYQKPKRPINPISKLFLITFFS